MSRFNSPYFRMREATRKRESESVYVCMCNNGSRIWTEGSGIQEGGKHLSIFHKPIQLNGLRACSFGKVLNIWGSKTTFLALPRGKSTEICVSFSDGAFCWMTGCEFSKQGCTILLPTEGEFTCITLKLSMFERGGWERERKGERER